MADGFSLNIDAKFLKQLEIADKSMSDLTDKSNQLSKIAVDAFNKITTQGVEPYIEKLKQQKSALEAIANVKFSEPATQEMGKLVSSSKKAIDNINNIINSLKGISTPLDMKRHIEEQKRVLSDFTKYETTLLMDRIAKNDSYNAKLIQQDRNYHEQRKRMYEDLFSAQAKAQQDASALLGRVYARTGGSEWNVSAESVIRQNQQDLEARRQYIEQRKAMYEKMFDEIAKREKQVQDDIRNYEQRQFEDNLRRYKQRKQDQANVDKHYHDLRQKQYDDMFRAIDRNEKRQLQINQKYGDSSKGALNYFDRLYSGFKPLSLNNMQTAISKLQDAQNRLDLTTEEGIKKYAELDKRIQLLQRNINATTNSINNMGKSHRGLMDTAGQLTRKLALVFSVSQIQGYIGKLIQVRGEFELQQKSLQVLLQSKDEADKLWQQTIDLAVRSPFRVKELVSYTRQLAAYRVETSKLHETTKMLADVSAGLGVDMNRIILAFGQVRAANFLRGTELRQFTEAGIPMLDELAKLFTELEGRMVSAGDVFERISKRMVTFSDVEEVFARMTNAGGVFYNMQEEQSKTLQGMISNLRDSIDLMLNDIGKANDGLLKGSVDAAKNFVENWREIAFYIENAVIALASWKIANAAFIIGSQKAATTTLWFNSALKANIGSSMINIKILKWSEAALVGVTKQQWLLGRATMYLQGILRGIGKFAIRTIVPLAVISGVIELYRHLTKASRQAKELQKALNEIYTEDSSNLERQTNVFKDLVERLQKVNVGSKEHKDIISQLNSQYGEYLGFLVTEKTTYDEIATSVNSVVEALRQKTKAQTFEKSFSKILEDNIKEINTLQSDIEEKVSEIGVYRSNNKPSLMPTISELDDIFALYEQKVKKANNLINVNELFSEYYGENLQVAANVSDKFAQIGRKILEQKTEEDKLQQRLNGLYGDGVYSTKQMRDEMDALNKEREKALQAEKTRIGKEKIEYDYLVKKTRLEGKYQGLSEETINANVAKLQKTSETIRDINRRIIESTDELGAEAVDRVYITAQDASQGVNAIAESMAAGYKSMQEEIKNQNALKEAGTVHDQKSLDNAETMSKAYYKVLEIMGRLDLLKAKGDKKESALKILNNRINLIKEINKEYEKLNEKFDATKAKEQVLNAYKDTFKDAFEGTGVKFSGLVIDKNKLIEEGKKSGEVFSEEMVKKMNEVIKSGTYIRSSSDKFKEELKKDEGVLFQLYDDSTKKIIKNTKDFQNAVGTVTIGWGHAIKNIDEAAKYFGKTISEQEAQDIFDKDVDKHVQALNKVLDKYQDLILTQEQYDSLLNATFQGGGGMISSAINYAMDIDKGIKHFDLLDVKLKKVGKTFSEEFGSDFIERFKNAETATERLALALETVGLTTVASGSNIDTNLYKGMKKRAQERAAEFRGDLEIVQLLQRSAINVSQIDFTNIKGVIDTLKQLEPIAKKEGKEAELALSKAISQLEAEVGLNLKIKDDKTLIDYVESLFGDYEVSLELEKLNIPPDLAKQLFNVDSVDLSSIRSKIESELAKARTAGGNKDLINELEEKLKKVDELEDKQLKERLKKYSKYLTEAMGERVKIKMEEIRQINEIDNLNDLTQSQKELAKQGVRKESQAKMDKLEWEEFKDSGMYVQLFEDLEYASTKSLRAMREQLILLKGSLKNLDADDLKHLYSQIEKLEAQISSRNPFKEMVVGIDDYIKAIKRSKELEENLSTAQSWYNLSKNQEKNIDEQLAKKRAEYEQKSKGGKLTQKEHNEYIKIINDLESQLRLVRAIVDEKGELLKNAQNEVNANNNTKKSFKESAEEVGRYISEAASALPQVAGDLENVFGTMSAGTKDTIDSISTIAGGVGDAISGFASGNYIQAIAGVAKAIGGIFAIGDKKKERQIQHEIKFVEDLERAYQKLEKQIDKAYTIDTLKRSYDNANKNLNEQIAARQRMIQQEEDKKKTDNDRIKEWQQEIEDLREQQEELLKTQVDELGGGYDYSSMTEEFVDAWISAYKEAGDGLKGLEDNFDEFFKNIAIKQAVMGGASKILEPFFNAVNKALENDFKIDDSEMAVIDKLGEQSMANLDDFLKQWYSKWGEYMGSEGQGELSGLQRGIQSVSESTAQIIEAYMASVRFYVADSNSKLTMIANQIVGSDETTNPMLSELRSQTELIRSIRDMFSSVIRNGHPTFGGAFIKVAL